nr:MAG TPA: hypothetical protein [Bacteriophage sp.]
MMDIVLGFYLIYFLRNASKLHHYPFLSIHQSHTEHIP